MGISTYPAVATSEIIYSAGEALQGECVEFHLIYQGNQLTSDGRPNVKYAIRKEFHPQLKQLWKSNSQLGKLARGRGIYADRTTTLPDTVTPEDSEASFFEWMGRLYARGNHHFVPLIEQSFCVDAF